MVARSCRLIEESEDIPSLKGLAQAADLSTSHFHRLFKSVTGLTPKDYAEAHRASRVRDRLAMGRTVTEAMFDAGFSSSGRFYEKSSTILGMTPTRYRAGGANEDIRFAVGHSSLGAILVASSDKGVASILIGDNPDELVRDLRDRFPQAQLVGDDKDYQSMIIRIIDFVEAPRIGLHLPPDVRGTAFQRRLWQALQAIPVERPKPSYRPDEGVGLFREFAKKRSLAPVIRNDLVAQWGQCWTPEEVKSEAACNLALLSASGRFKRPQRSVASGFEEPSGSVLVSAGTALEFKGEYLDGHANHHGSLGR